MDYENPEYVNALTPADLFAALQRGDVRNLALIDDDRLAAALAYDLQDNTPEMLQWLGNDDLFRALRADASTLLSNRAMVREFEGRISRNQALMNGLNEPENREIRQQWFASHNIALHENAKIFSLQEGMVRTGKPGRGVIYKCFAFFHSIVKTVERFIR